MAFIASIPTEDEYLPDQWFDKDPANQQAIRQRSVFKHFLLCTAIPDEEKSQLPQKLIVKPQKGFWPDYFPISGFRAWAVSQAFTDIVEEIEPGVHEFFKLEFVKESGESWDVKYFMLHICTKLQDFVDLENSEHAEMVEEATGPPELGIKVRILKRRGRNADRLVLIKSVIEKHHLWKGGGGQFNTNYFMSDRLAKAVQSASLSKLDFEFVEEL